VLAHDVGPAGEQHHEDEQGRRQRSVEHRRPEEHLDGVQPCIIQAEAERHGNGDDSIEAVSEGRVYLQRANPVGRFRDGVGARSGQYRDSEHAGSDQTQAEEPVRAGAGQRTQRLGGIARGGDGGFAVRVQRGGGRENDEVHHQVRKEHAGEDVVRERRKFPLGRAFALFDGRLAQAISSSTSCAACQKKR
jgi:hypothetical protein